ncbi:MAG: hypothetical protein PHG48_00900 [Eubacteriales bacterium]|nr:hypothetical protein [Eubacteriales bacterium]
MFGSGWADGSGSSYGSYGSYGSDGSGEQADVWITPKIFSFIGVIIIKTAQ